MTNFKSPQPTIDGSSTDPITRRFMEARNRLVATDFYLGDPAKTFKDLVMWKRVGRGNRLVTKESVIAVEKAQQAQAAAEAASGEAILEADTEALLEPAVLSVIVLIDQDDCWLTPCGYWKGPTAFTPSFEDLKLSFQGKSATNSILFQDFAAAVEGAKWLMNEVALGGSANQGFLGLSKGSDAFKFRHVVFEKKLEDKADGNNGSDTASDSDGSWTMADWPVIHSAAAAQRDQLAATHRPVPLPAYDFAGNLITPERCKNALAGAVVRVSFTLTHWFIDKGEKEQSKNSFVADVQSIRVLLDPPSQAMSPKKRKTGRRDPGEGSPSKRANKF